MKIEVHIAINLKLKKIACRNIDIPKLKNYTNTRKHTQIKNGKDSPAGNPEAGGKTAVPKKPKLNAAAQRLPLRKKTKNPKGEKS